MENQSPFLILMKIFPLVILASAICIAAVAGFFSISGIATLFAGASLSAMAMAGALEFGKLVSASFLYRYWNDISKSLRTYMMIGTFVLILITSLGIYGYLANAYAVVASGAELSLNQISLVEQQTTSVDSSIARSSVRLAAVENSRSQSENRLSQVIEKSARNTRSQESSIRSANSEARQIRNDIQSLQNKKDSLSSEKVRLQNSIMGNRELGSFLYVSKAVGVPLDTVVKWFILILVLVFDPMSIALFLAYNISIKKKEINVEIEKEKLVPYTSQEILPTFAHEPFVQNVNIPLGEGDTQSIVELDNFNGPYYRHPNYDWENDLRWKHDAEAIAWRRVSI